MSNDVERAVAFSLLNHEHLRILCKLRIKFNIALESEIGMFLSEGRDNRRLYLAYYFDYNEVEYKFVICVNREDRNGTLFHFGFCRKDNRKIVPTDVLNCKSILDVVNAKLDTNYGFSKGKTCLYLNPMSVNELTKFLDAACPNLIKISKTESDIWKPKSGFITVTKAKRLINLQ